MSATPEDAGSIVSELRLSISQMDKDAMEAQRKMDALAGKFGEKGKAAGAVYVQGFGKAQQQLNTRLNNMVGSLASISPKMGALGVQMATAFSSPIFAAVPAVSMAFSTMLGPIGMVIGAVRMLWGWVEKAIAFVKSKTEEAVDDVKKKINDIKEAAATKNVILFGEYERGYIQKLDKLKGELSVVNNKLKEQQTVLEDLYNMDARARAELRGSYNERVREAQKNIDQSYEQIKQKQIEIDIEESLQNIHNMRFGIYDKEKNLRKEITILEERNKDGKKGELQIQENTVKSLKTYLSTLDEIIISNERNAEVIHAEKDREILLEKIAVEEKKLKLLADEAKAEKDLADEIAARDAAILKYNQAVQKASDARKAGLIDEEETEKQISSALAQKYNDLESIVTQYKLTTGATVKLRDKTAELVKQNQDLKWLGDVQKKQADDLVKVEIERLKAKAEGAKTEAEKNIYLEKAIVLENEIIDRQRLIEREALKIHLESMEMSAEARDEILKNFDKITDGMKKINKASKANDLFSFDNLFAIGEKAIDTFDSISNAALEISRQHAEEQMAIIDKALEGILKNIEDARKAELIAAGFAVQNNIESLEAQLEAAKLTGDEVLIYQAERRAEEQRINDKYDAEAKAKQEAAAKEKAEIEFNLAKQEYDMKMTNAINAGILAVINALATPVPWPVAAAFGIAAGTATGAQITLLAKNPPKMQTYESGGIVPGTSYTGDKMPALVNSREGIFTLEDQEYLFDQIQGRKIGGNTVTATIVVMLDAKEIGQETFELANKGHYTLKTRAVQG
jgi:hypothetical protein